MPKTGDIIAAKYRIEQLIGLGGMGAVFSALHQFTGKRIALKWMLPELAQDGDAVARFMREAQAAGRINHPNVVDVYDVGQHDSSYFLVMEYLQGEPLTSALARRDMTATEVLTLLLPAMRGVAAAHRQGVVHRDLKPDNIFLAYEEDGVRREAKVLDFGISKLSVDDQPNLHLTRTGAVVGTPYYMSPEQIRGAHGLDRRADVYAFGVILYEALTGRVPFHADTYGALVLEIATGTARPPNELVPSLPAELSRVVLRAMARDVNARYATMEDLIAALEPFASVAQSGAAWTAVPSITNLEETQIDPVTPQELPQMVAPLATVATKPQLASTPFASETSRTGALGSSTLLGVAGFITAAAVIVGAIWYFTREPEAQPALAMPMDSAAPESQVSQSAATAPPPDESSLATSPTGSRGGLPSGISPGAVPPLDPAEAANALTIEPVGAAETGIGRRVGSVKPVHVDDSVGSASKHERGAQSSLRSGGRDSSAAREHAAASRRAEARRESAHRAAARNAASSARRAPDVDTGTSQSKAARIEPATPEGRGVAPRLDSHTDTPSSAVPIHRARSGALNVNEF